MPVIDWARLLRCTECGVREPDFVVSGDTRSNGWPIPKSGCDYRLGGFRTTVAVGRLLRHGLVHNRRRDRRSAVSVRNGTLLAQISLTPPMVDESDDDHRADNYKQEPRKFCVEHAR